MSEYASAAGFIQFDPREREANGQKVRDVSIRAFGGNKTIRVTVWSEFGAVPLAKGDLIFVDGKFSTNQAQNKEGAMVTYFNLSASMLVRIPGAQKAERGVANTTTTAAPATEESPF